MGRRIEQLTIDGVSVDVSKARFADTFDVAEADERRLAFDEDVVYVVVGRVSTPSFRETKAGEVSRVNVLKVREARLVNDEGYKASLLEKLRFDYRPQPSLFDDTPVPEEDTEDEPEIRLLEQEPVVVEADPDPEPDPEEDEGMKNFIEAMKQINDEYDDGSPSEVETPVPSVAGARVVGGRHLGQAETDDVLRKFMGF